MLWAKTVRKFMRRERSPYLTIAFVSIRFLALYAVDVFDNVLTLDQSKEIGEDDDVEKTVEAGAKFTC